MDLSILTEKIKSLEEVVSRLSERLNLQNNSVEIGTEEVQQSQNISFISKNKEMPDGVVKFLEMNLEIQNIFDEDMEIKEEAKDDSLTKEQIITNFFERNKSVKKNSKSISFIKFRIRGIKKAYKFKRSILYNPTENLKGGKMENLKKI
jgi:hypothetical protein